jgi:hypothetical protein
MVAVLGFANLWVGTPMAVFLVLLVVSRAGKEPLQLRMKK